METRARGERQPGRGGSIQIKYGRMGVHYSVFPMGHETREWLVEDGVVDETVRDGRLPTPRELVQAAGALAEVDVEIAGDPPSGILLSSGQAWAQVNLTDPQGMDLPVEFSFEKGTPELIVRLLVALTNVTGTLALVADTGDEPVVIAEDDEVASVLARWDEASRSFGE